MRFLETENAFLSFFLVSKLYFTKTKFGWTIFSLENHEMYKFGVGSHLKQQFYVALDRPRQRCFTMLFCFDLGSQNPDKDCRDQPSSSCRARGYSCK